MKKYYLQIYYQDSVPESQTARILMEDLPFQPLLLERIAALGVIEPRNGSITLGEADKVSRILRIRQTFGVNISGAAIIVDLLDRMEEKEEFLKHRSIE